MKMPPAKKTFKIVIVGDGNIGKTCFLMVKTFQKFLEDFEPTCLENYTTTVDYRGEAYELDLWDISGIVKHFYLDKCSVVYLDQPMGAVHYIHWLKHAFFMLLCLFLPVLQIWFKKWGKRLKKETKNV